MSFDTFCLKFDLFDRKQYDNIIKAIPQSIIQMSFNISQSNVTPCLPRLLVNGVSLTHIHLPNIIIRKAFVKELYPYSSNKNSISQYFSSAEIRKLRTKYLTFPIAPKAKEVHFKILSLSV